MTDHSDETLMAFADGMLDEPLFSAVAEAVEHDEALAARLEQLVDGARLAREGFAPLLEPVSPALEASVRAMIARKARRPLRTWQINLAWLLPAAGVAAAVMSVVVALPLLQPSAQPSWGGIEQSQLQAALDTLPSGADHVLKDGGTLHAVASFTDSTGTLCREFEVPGYVMVACRAGTDWQVTMAVANGTAEGYQTASGLAVLDAYLNEIGASAPLLELEERAALNLD
nr:hypothetical protein [uncultured Devosia sp.]